MKKETQIIEFTYYDYLAYKRIINKKGLMQLRDQESIYNYNENGTGKNKINNPHDKIFRKVLDDRERIAEIINEKLNLKEKIRPEEIEKYNSSFISPEFINQESDVVYKMKVQNVFFLIEHQSKIDYSMPYRILNYEMAIIRSALDHKTKLEKGEKIPKVIPIVIYTGDKKWDAKRFIEETQELFREEKFVPLGSYHLIDVNDYEKEELLKKGTLFNKMLLLEKAKTSEELFNNLEEILEQETKEKNKNFLKSTVYYIYKEKLGKENTKIILKKFGKEGEKSMILEMIRKENEELINKGRNEGLCQGEAIGRKKGIVEIVQEMLKNKMNDKTITKITKVDSKQLQEIKERLGLGVK